MTPARVRRRQVLLRAWHEFLRGRGFDSAASLTFFSALSALPAALLGVSVAALVIDRSRAARAIEALLATVLSDDDRVAVRSTIADLLEHGSGVVVLVALALTLWTVSGYAAAFGRMVNTVYEVQEGRFFPLLRARMVLLAVPLVALGAVIAAVLIVTPEAARDIAPDAGAWRSVWVVGRWPLLVLAIVGVVGLLFRYAPNVRFTRIRWLGIGTAVSLVVWAVLTAGFALYATLTGNYGHLYGRLGVLLAALIWSYLSNLALVIGAQIDAELMRMRQLENGDDAVEAIRVPVKDTSRQTRLADHRAGDTEVARRIRDESAVTRRSAPERSG